jgi:toxin ParE1/3/4
MIGTVRHTSLAIDDLADIELHTESKWGRKQPDKYLQALEECAIMLARNPSLGRPCDHLNPGLLRFEKGRHAIFYQAEKDGILIARVLHQSMQSDLHEFEDESPDSPSN